MHLCSQFTGGYLKASASTSCLPSVKMHIAGNAIAVASFSSAATFPILRKGPSLKDSKPDIYWKESWKCSFYDSYSWDT